MGSAAMTVPRAGFLDDRIVVAGVLNLLGEGFNPFEFLPHQPEFMECYEKLLYEWDNLKWQHISEFIDLISTTSSAKISECFTSLKEHCEQSETGQVASYFLEKVLQNDNKFLDHRLNLITFAMRPFKYHNNTVIQWELLKEADDSKPLWLVQLGKLFAMDSGSYVKDPRIFCWDFCCCVLAQRQQQSYFSICGMSHLNPVNETGGEGFFDAASAVSGTDHIPLLLGLLEWPVQVSRTEAFMNTCARRKLNVTLGTQGGVALVSSASLGVPILLTNGAQVKAREVMETVINDIQKESNEQLVKKEIDGLLDTTALKTLACIVPLKANDMELSGNWLVCVVVHSKEPKNPITVRAFALFLSRMVVASQNSAFDALLLAQPRLSEEEHISAPDFSNFIVMSDTNIATERMAEIFRDELRDLQLVASPADPRVCTTRKRRSRLHGQCYDNKKCHVTVAAPKDCIITAQGRFTSSESVFPNISSAAKNDTANISPFGDTIRTLPDADWMSDHCLVTSAFTIKNGPRVRIPPDNATHPSPPISPNTRMRTRSFHSGFFDEDSGDEEAAQ